MKFFTADEHYGHRNILKFCKRPFENIDDMREQLISRHNFKVTAQDETYHIGDVFWNSIKPNEALDILTRLNGRHYLVWGNHDETSEKLKNLDLKDGRKSFDWMKDVYKLRTDGYPDVWLSHYAHRVWPNSHKGSYHVYGHTHGGLPDFRRSHDVGVDANGYFPVSLAELDSLMKSKVIAPDEVEIDMNKNKWEKGENDGNRN